MGPRKRSKPNSISAADPNPLKLDDFNNQPELPIESSTLVDSTRQLNRNDKKIKALEADSVKGVDRPVSIKSGGPTWYGGTWPRGGKTAPVTHVAVENMSSNTSINDVSTAHGRENMLDRGGISSRNSPAFKKLSSSSQISSSPSMSKSDESTRIKAKAEDSVLSPPDTHSGFIEEHNGYVKAGMDTVTSKAKTSSHPSDAGWLGWLSGPGQSSVEDQKTNSMNEYQNHVKLETGLKVRKPPQTMTDTSPSGPRKPSENQHYSRYDAGRSWLGSWGRKPTDSKVVHIIPQENPSDVVGAGLDPSVNGASKAGPETEDPKPSDSSRLSGWAFWSRNTEASIASDATGELALLGTASESKPEKDQISVTKGIPSKVSKRSRPQSSDESVEGASKTANGSSESSTQSLFANANKLATATTNAQSSQNLLLPSFQSTFESRGRPGLLHLVQKLSSWLPFATRPSKINSLDLIASAPAVKKVLVIGVHGFFPAPLVRSFLGHPTGTSIRFSNEAADAVTSWAHRHGMKFSVEKVALEGDGKIAERVNMLWGLLLNWVDKIRMADFIFFACHSQGCPVTMMLIAKLISFGCVDNARIGVCAMAGVNMGPFIDYRTRLIGATAVELFDFANPESKVSKEYAAAMTVALEFGVKIAFVGSIDDQVVSLDSSTFGIASHPHIYRAVFIDGRIHASDFLAHLVGFALKLRNLGISDHGLIRELSAPLAGSLYTGEGHSRIYEDQSVYTLALEFALETTTLRGIPIQMQSAVATGNQNPYILPFAMRGLIEEEHVRTEMYGEVTELINQFDAWKPNSKALKDVKFRLEGVRSKL